MVYLKALTSNWNTIQWFSMVDPSETARRHRWAQTDKRRAIEFGTHYYSVSGCLGPVTALISTFSFSVCHFLVISAQKFHMGFCGLLGALASGETFESSTPSEMTRKYSAMPRGEFRRGPGGELRDGSQCISVLRMRTGMTSLIAR